MSRLAYALCGAIALAGCLVASAQSAFVVDNNGNRRRADAIDADTAGNLAIKIGASTLNMKRGQYRFVVTPKPPDVAKLEQFAEQGRHKVVLDNAGKIYDKYKFLGWGGYIAAVEAESRLASNDAAGALRTLDAAAAREIVGRHVEVYSKAKISALIALDRGDEAAPLLQKLKASADNDLAAFAFLSDGKILESQGRKQEALLAYLKTVLLFKDGVVDAEKQEARQRVAALLDEMGNPRADDFR